MNYPHTPTLVPAKKSLTTPLTHPAFEWLRSEQIPSLKLEMQEFCHRETGAIHYHLACENPENVFLVAVRTVPMDSTGVAHILEHTTLCGSEKYPVRDPFFMMIRRSLNTFMNAFTSSDWTAYPFASKNRKDYFNLLNVYLDAVFFSRLDELDFAQEGHRLEFTELENRDSALQYKGVVYNEMKGAMSSTNNVLWHSLCKVLYPTTTYHYNSGGDPADIPRLSYRRLKEFYRSHYHPSNAVFMTFGDIPAAELQTRFENLALHRFRFLDVNIQVQDEKRLASPIREQGFYASEANDANKTHIVTGWLLGKSTNLTELFKAQLLSSVLLDNSASPLLKALETTELGTSPSPLCGLEDSNREMSFICGLEGCNSEATSAVEKLILNTLKNVESQGVPQAQVDAALHQLELQQREITGDNYPYGLQLILAGLSSAVHRGDPIKLLNIDPVLSELREAIKDKNFIPQLVRKLLLNNPHRITLTLKPDPTLAEREAASELARLSAIRNSMNDDQIKAIIERGKALAARQQQEDDIEILPKVTLKDVPKGIEVPVGQSTLLPLQKGNLPVSFYAQGTNGLCYQQIVIDLPLLDEILLGILPYFSSCIGELGIGKKDYTEVQTWQSSVSGGIKCYSNIHGAIDNEQSVRGVTVLSSKALVANHAGLSELLAATLKDLRLDEGQRVQEIIEQLCASAENSITAHGHTLAVSLASSRMSPTAVLNHRFAGLESIRQLKLMREELSDAGKQQQLLERFHQLHEILISCPRQVLMIAEADHQSAIQGALQHHWQDNPLHEGFSALQLPPSRKQTRQAWTTSTQVSFIAKAYASVPSAHTDHAPLTVLAGFMRNGFLHRAIREKGGAYGGGAGQDANSASFRFYSYRDPRLDDTLDDFDRAIDWVITGRHPSRLLEEAILGVIGGLDKPSSPAGEAKQAFYDQLFGRTLEHQLEFRRKVLNVSADDLKRVAETWLKPELASIGIITSRGELAKSKLSGIEVVNL